MLRRVDFLVVVTLAGFAGYWILSNVLQGQRWEAAEQAARDRYEAEYAKWLASEPQVLIRALVERRGPMLTRRAPSPLLEVVDPAPVQDPLLAALLADPDAMA